MKATLRLHFDSYWQAGTGAGGGADVDEFFDRDDKGLPCLRGRRLKGLIKDAARLHQRCGQPAPLSLEEAFATEKREADKLGRLMDVRNAVVPEPARSQLLARRNELAGLSETLSSTAMEESGVAKDKTLRRIEAAIPMSLDAEIEWADDVASVTGKHGVTPQAVFDWLKKVLRLLRYAGRHRHRGLGRCRAELVPDNTAGDKPESSAATGTRHLTLRLTLKDAVVMSAHASSAGPHETLDYLAGSALWGAASPLYATWAKKGEWNKIEAVFHSGKVRFLPGLPAGSGGRALLPAPLSWHFKKGAKFADMGRLSLSDDVKLVSLCASEWNFERDGQPQQVRGGWFSPDGDYQTVEREHQAKTAIDEKKFDRANDGQFFGYTAIAADKSFIARVEADADTPGWDEVVKHLRARKELRLGRSKTAEYGRASAELVDDSKWAIPAANASGPADCVFIHALTDLALVDSNGQPTLHPDPSVFGLSGWDLNPERTFIQVRSYSLWNRFRGAHDSERQVIKAGSVIAFKKSTASVASSGPGGSKQGYSLAWRENGLGLFAVNPAYLFQVPTPAATQSADAASGPAEEPREVEEPKSTDAEIIQTAHARFCRRTLQHLALALGREWAGRWQKGGLSKSQWARLREAAVNARDREHLLSELLLNDDTGLFKHGLSSKKWGDADDDGTPANSVCTSLNDRGAVALKAELRRARLPEKEDYVSTLALHACREAAIACARAKRND